ncbi:hypothetical protein BH09ACT7_BH09ACT7_37590 [soil metagenome]
MEEAKKERLSSACREGGLELAGLVSELHELLTNAEVETPIDPFQAVDRARRAYFRLINTILNDLGDAAVDQPADGVVFRAHGPALSDAKVDLTEDDEADLQKLPKLLDDFDHATSDGERAMHAYEYVQLVDKVRESLCSAVERAILRS